MPPADENPKGFFENQSIVDQNDKILEELFTFWNETFFIPEDWWKEKKFEEYRTRIHELLSTEFSSEEPILIKDPRLCVLLPLYLDVFSQSAIEPQFIICVRNPAEVANSLKRRNNLSREKSFLIWMDYQLKADWYSRAYKRIFVAYNDFLEEPVRAIKEIIEFLGLDNQITEHTGQEILSFLDPSLTHKIADHEMTAVKHFADITSFFQFQASASLRDLNIDELSVADQYRENFYEGLRLWNGLPEKYEASLTIDHPNNKKTVHVLPVHYGVNHLKFNIDPNTSVKRLILRPCNARVAVRMINIEAHSTQNEHIELAKPDNSAGSRNEQGFMVFENDLPKIVFNFQPVLALSRIEFTLDYLAFGVIPNRKVLWRKS